MPPFLVLWESTWRLSPMFGQEQRSQISTDWPEICDRKEGSFLRKAAV